MIAALFVIAGLALGFLAGRKSLRGAADLGMMLVKGCAEVANRRAVVGEGVDVAWSGGMMRGDDLYEVTIKKAATRSDQLPPAARERDADPA